MAHQRNVFASNRPGRLERLTEVLEEEGINIRVITVAGTDDFGVIKLLVDARIAPTRRCSGRVSPPTSRRSSR